jgi:vacuolar-type H+-ATPase subunit C/Vma6
MLLVTLHADVYNDNCMKCHKNLPVDIDKFYYRYLLKYSSQQSVKDAMIKYLKNPDINTTIMPKSFIRRFGVKKPTTLNDEKLHKAIDIYLKKYKVSNRLK